MGLSSCITRLAGWKNKDLPHGNMRSRYRGRRACGLRRVPCGHDTPRREYRTVLVCACAHAASVMRGEPSCSMTHGVPLLLKMALASYLSVSDKRLFHTHRFGLCAPSHLAMRCTDRLTLSPSTKLPHVLGLPDNNRSTNLPQDQ